MYWQVMTNTILSYDMKNWYQDYLLRGDQLRVLELVYNADNMSSKRKKNQDQFTKYAWYEKLISRLPFLGENSHMNFSFPF